MQFDILEQFLLTLANKSDLTTQYASIIIDGNQIISKGYNYSCCCTMNNKRQCLLCR